jgi:hypothetical protein
MGEAFGNHTKSFAVVTAESAVAGAAAIGSASMAGTTVTVGGAAATGVAGVATVGAPVVATAAISVYACKKQSGEVTTGPVAGWLADKYFKWLYGL